MKKENSAYFRIRYGTEESPVGIAKVPIDKQCWVKVGKDSVRLLYGKRCKDCSKNEEKSKPISLTEITETEYDVDVEFDLFPILPITTRPVRTAIVKHQITIWLIFMLSIPIFLLTFDLTVGVSSVLAIVLFFLFSLMFSNILDWMEDHK